MRYLSLILVNFLLVMGVAFTNLAQVCAAVGDSVEKPVDFTKFSLEELKNVEIVSASKKPEKLSEVAGAVHVITQNDIRRSGATSIPEALRLAPGVHVARISATDWAINIRGLNSQYAQNLLVLIDGRSVYTHVFSGVFWDIQDTVMEDIDRIEVIRGPGAALWGANAVNGVINIITKHSKNTMGWRGVVLGGSEEQIGSLRYGSTLEQGGTYRVYGKIFNRGELSGVGLDPAPDSAKDAQSSDNWRSGRGGFRIDLAPGQGMPDGTSDSFTLQGEAYTNRYDKKFERRSSLFPSAISTHLGDDDNSEASGLHLLGRWQHTLSRESDTVLQVYYDYLEKDYDPASGRVSTADVDFQHRLTVAEINEILWGLEFKYIHDNFKESPNVTMDPSDLNQTLWSTFVQDQIQIMPRLLTFIAGSKFEYNEDTGLEIQPSVRLMYTPYDWLSSWAAISRAVRVPSRIELHGRTSDLVPLPAIDPVNPVEVVTLGNRDLDSEKLTAYEIGFRLKPLDRLWLDTTLFFNNYDELIGLEMSDTPLPGDMYTLVYDNNSSGEAYGFEFALDWKAASTWLMGASYTYLRTQIEENQVTDQNIAPLISKGSNPRHSFSIRSAWDVTPTIDFDLWLRFVSRLPERDVASYTVMDARLAWRPYQHIELSLVGQNLFEEGHEEFSTLEVKRSVYGKVNWQF